MQPDCCLAYKRRSERDQLINSESDSEYSNNTIADGMLSEKN